MEEETKVALAHGITVGGGASLMVPMKFSVVSEKTVFCMPEASIGFHTDCIFSYILSRLPGHMGVASMSTIESTESLSSMVSSKVDIIRKGNHVGPKVPTLFSRVSSEDSPVFTEWQDQAKSPLPEPTLPIEKKNQETKVVVPEAKKEEQIISVVLMVYMHCETCAQEVAKYL